MGWLRSLVYRYRQFRGIRGMVRYYRHQRTRGFHRRIWKWGRYNIHACSRLTPNGRVSSIGIEDRVTGQWLEGTTGELDED